MNLQLRKYRAVCTVEFLRTTWEKTNNPFIRLITSHTRPKLGIKRRIVLPRPTGSPYSKPIIGWLYFDGTEDELSKCRNVILDIPGGGFVCMAPNHHDERLHHWAKRKGWAILALDYAKAPGEHKFFNPIYPCQKKIGLPEKRSELTYHLSPYYRRVPLPIRCS